MAEIREFGRIGDDIVHEIRLRSPGGATASILTLGAAIRDLVVPMPDGSTRRVVLGRETVEGYRVNPGSLGIMVGRCANRIAGGRFRLDGRDHALPINNAGVNTLHGGPDGFGKRNWQLEGVDEGSVDLSLVSPDGDQGFPGQVEVRLRYALTDLATFAITASATCEAPTPVNLTNHAYFTLQEGVDCRAHLLEIAADFYTPSDETLIPTGAVLPVAGTPFDFRRARPIENDYDINMVLAGAPGEMVRAAVATAPDGRLRMEVETDQPGLQLYTAQGLGQVDSPVGGVPHGPHAGFCLEAQGFVDAPNKRHFPSVTLRPGMVYRHATTYRFVPLPA